MIQLLMVWKDSSHLIINSFFSINSLTNLLIEPINN
jgi:hypothetical protein